MLIRDFPSGEMVRLISKFPSSSSTSSPSALVAFLSSEKIAETCALSLPVRTRSASLFPPRIRPRAVSTIVLPAPVSPVRTFSPGCNSIFADSITPRFRIEISSKP